MTRRAWSRKNLWEKLPPPLRRGIGSLLSCIPLPYILGHAFRRNLRLVRRADFWSADQSAEYQLRELRRICMLAYEKTGYYHRAFSAVGFHPSDLKTLEDLRRLPTITKDTINEHLPDMCTVSPQSSGIDFVSTGGTSGVPLHFYQNAGRSAVEYAYLVTSWGRAGYRLGDTLAVFRGRVIDPDRHGFYHEYDPLLRHHYYGNFHMTDDHMAGYLAHMATLGPFFLHVYPSSVAALAAFVRRAGLRPPANLRGILAESEIVYPDQRQRVQKIFPGRYLACYGHTEKLILAAECEHTTDYHVWPTYGYFELLDDAGRPVTTPGTRGEIVGTGFMNTAVPFIRYRTGDFATYVADHCAACGRRHPVLRDIQGHRIQEMLIARDGSEISWTALNMHDDTFSSVRQFQFRQDTPGKAVLRIIPTGEFGDKDMERIKANLSRKLDGRIEFSIQITDHIPLSPRGKAVYIDQCIPKER